MDCFVACFGCCSSQRRGTLGVRDVGQAMLDKNTCFHCPCGQHLPPHPALSWIIRGVGGVTSDLHLTGSRPTENPLSRRKRVCATIETRTPRALSLRAEQSNPFAEPYFCSIVNNCKKCY